MSDRSAPQLAIDATVPPPLAAEDFSPEFRVVSRAGVRRGIRLERGFWSALKRMAESRRCTIGLLIDEIAQHAGDSANLTSAIRVACLRSVTEQNQVLSKLASIKTVNAILLACPAPAFSIETSKKILTFNSSFQQLVRRQLPAGLDGNARPDLKLALYLSVSEILAKLSTNGEAPVPTGFVIGAGERRYRGLLNAVRAPVAAPELLIAFVVNS